MAAPEEFFSITVRVARLTPSAERTLGVAVRVVLALAAEPVTVTVLLPVVSPVAVAVQVVDCAAVDLKKTKALYLPVAMVAVVIVVVQFELE